MGRLCGRETKADTRERLGGYFDVGVRRQSEEDGNTSK